MLKTNLSDDTVVLDHESRQLTITAR